MPPVRQGTILAVLAILYCFAPLCNAVGFGNLKVNSYLKQPLAATIQLTGCRDIDPMSIQARLAAPQDFKRAGIARTAELYNLIFEIIDNDANPKVSIRTTEPIQSQYLEFLIELEWDNGKLVKNYVILLDSAPKNVKKKDLKKSVATAAKAVTKKAEAKKEIAKSISKKAKTTVANTKLDTPLLPNVVPDIADMEMNIEVTKPALPVQAATIISNIKAVIKTELAAKVEPAIQTEPIANTEPEVETIIQAEPTTLIPAVLPQQEDMLPVTNELATTAIPTVSEHNYIYLIIALIILLAVTIIYFVTQRKYSINESSVIMRTPTKSIAKNNVLQMKIDLARQYLEIGDQSSARELLSEVIVVAQGAQRTAAEDLQRAIR